MTTIPTTPIEIDEEVYDLYTASLSLMVRHTKGGGSKTGVNVRLVPTRFESGEVVSRDDHARCLTYGDALNGSADVAAAVETVLSAVQAFIYGRGL